MPAHLILLDFITRTIVLVLAWNRSPSLRDERPTTNRLSHETTYGLPSPRLDTEFVTDFLRS
jgi:hypothetical protein